MTSSTGTIRSTLVVCAGLLATSSILPVYNSIREREAQQEQQRRNEQPSQPSSGETGTTSDSQSAIVFSPSIGEWDRAERGTVKLAQAVFGPVALHWLEGRVVPTPVQVIAADRTDPGLALLPIESRPEQPNAPPVGCPVIL